ncbi:MAG: hypothetical protein Q8R30_01755 [bacterium]|nr:hypothetical protein [bacterium]MDZ4285354.1 hypothetical protein [Candidatus Sungbacteria bacterium]
MKDAIARLRAILFLFRHRKKAVFVALLTLLVLTQGVFLIYTYRSWRPLSGSSLESYANDILKTCAQAGYRPSCYEKEIPLLMDVISMEQAFEVIRIVQDKDPSYQYCHVLGHNLSAREVKKDPSKWKEVLTRCPSGVCSNGCLHGGLQERFRAESFTDAQVEQLKPDLETLCEAKQGWHPTGLEQASCYHALGHLTMYITNADINKSLNLCRVLSIKQDGRDFSHLCFDGAFMQIYQPLEPEDFALVKGKQPTKQTVGDFCAPYQGAERGSCRSESWPLFVDILQTPGGIIAICSPLHNDPAEEDRCYSALFYVITPRLNFDAAAITAFCQKLPEQRGGQCFANAASRMIETDYRNTNKAADLCMAAARAGSGDQCFQEMLTYSVYNFHVGSSESLELCSRLPKPWNDKCLARQSASN